MLYSGIAWNANGYEVEVIDGDGRPAGSPTRFGANQIPDIIAYLRGLDAPLVSVIDSTCGIVDGRLMVAGLDMYRADPWLLPARPVLGSAPAIDLARAAQRDLSALARLEIAGGTQTGREDDLNAGIDASAAAIAEMVSAGRCLSNGLRDRPEVALTFDDGPQPPYTGQILDVLRRYGVRATFFCVGLNAGAHPDELVRMRAEGHALANHTWSHPFLPDLSRPELVEQIERTDETIAKASGGPVPALFRPPYGSRTPQVVGWLGETDSTVVLWDIEADDWAMPGTDMISRTILDGVQPGSIILLHDGGGDRSQTVAALPDIIEGLLERGFRFVSVDDLVARVRQTSRT
jgi:peptidoglycan-N-acetylglucosamine deacetylase